MSAMQYHFNLRDFNVHYTVWIWDNVCSKCVYFLNTIIRNTFTIRIVAIHNNVLKILISIADIYSLDSEFRVVQKLFCFFLSRFLLWFITETVATIRPNYTVILLQLRCWFACVMTCGVWHSQSMSLITQSIFRPGSFFTRDWLQQTYMLSI